MSKTPSGVPVNAGTGIGSAGAWPALTRLCWRVCLAGVVGVALLGALVSAGLTMLVIALAVGGFTAFQTAVLCSEVRDRAAARRMMLLVGLGSALMVPFFMGVAALGEAGGVLTVVLVWIGALALVTGRRDRRSRSGALGSAGAGAGSGARAGADEAPLGELLRRLPTSALLEEWLSSEAVLDGSVDPERRAAAVRIRVLLMEEMYRRDPTGLERWLDEGTAGSPDRHVRGDSDPT